MFQRIGVSRHIRVATRLFSDASTKPPSIPSNELSKACVANCSYVADQLLIRIGLAEAPAYIRLIRLLITNPANANSVLLKRLTSAKRDLRWYNVWLRDVFIGAEGINTVPIVPGDVESETAAHEALVNALTMATKYEQSSLFVGADGNAGPGSEAAAAQRKSAEESIAKFFGAVPISVSLEIAGYVEDFALEKYRAEKLRNNMKKCCSVHTRALEPVLSHLGISVDGYTAAKITSGVKTLKNAHSSIFNELIEMLKCAEQHRTENPETLATAAMHSRVRDSLFSAATQAATGVGTGAKSKKAAGAVKMKTPSFTARHCLKIGIRCVDVRSQGSRSGSGRPRGAAMTAARHQAVSAAIAEMVEFYGHDAHPSSRVKATSVNSDEADALNGCFAEQSAESDSIASSQEDTGEAAAFKWNTGKFERYRVAVTDTHPASRVFRDRFLNVPAKKLRSQAILSAVAAVDLSIEAETSVPGGIVALDREKNKACLQNLPVDTTAEELALVLRVFGPVQSVEIFDGEHQGTYSELGSLAEAIERNQSDLPAPSPVVLSDEELSEEDDEEELLAEAGLLDEDIIELYGGDGGDRTRGVNPRLHEYLLTRSEEAAMEAGVASVTKEPTTLRLASTPRNPIATFSSMAVGPSDPTSLVRVTPVEGLEEGEEGKKLPRRAKEKELKPSKMMTQKLSTDCTAFVTFQNAESFKALMGEEIRILGLNIRTHSVRVTEAQGNRVLIVEILNNLVVKRIIEVLSSIMGGWYEFRLMDNLEVYSKPVFVHLSFSSHNDACVAHDKISAMMAISPNFPVRVHWHKTAWYHKVAAKSRQMEYNARRLVEGDPTVHK